MIQAFNLYSQVPFFIFVGIAAVIILNIVFFVRKWRVDKSNELLPVITLQATVSEKNKDVTSAFMDSSGVGSIDYKIQFQTEDGEKTFFVTRSIYKSIEEGEKGQLTFQGGRFISFDRL